jgi:hypothetical protein
MTIYPPGPHRLVLLASHPDMRAVLRLAVRGEPAQLMAEKSHDGHSETEHLEKAFSVSASLRPHHLHRPLYFISDSHVKYTWRRENDFNVYG